MTVTPENFDGVHPQTRVYICPFSYCSYVITEIEYASARFDYACPHCGKNTLSGFYPRVWTVSTNEAVLPDNARFVKENSI